MSLRLASSLISASYFLTTMARGAFPGRKPGREACFWKSFVMASNAASTAAGSSSTRTSFLHGAKFSTDTFTIKNELNEPRSIVEPRRLRQCVLTADLAILANANTSSRSKPVDLQNHHRVLV